MSLNVLTRWNSRYMMPNTAPTYQKVFQAYEENDTSFSVDVGDSMSSFLDWPSNILFYEISYLNCMLDCMVGAKISIEKVDIDF